MKTQTTKWEIENAKAAQFEEALNDAGFNVLEIEPGENRTTLTIEIQCMDDEPTIERIFNEIS